MLEEVKYIADQLTGPTGGIFALGAMVGATVCWVFFQRNILKIHTDSIERLRLHINESEKDCKIKIEKLEDRIKSLESERLRLAIKIGKKEDD